ncbi:MAG TPA: phosphoribosylformylglycinamidine synthase subunit PurS, partial [Tepidisphaeraceae bacterium]|nr:phosphoribosylformylglycinamidine synthase subunit PurS [Tepidisphaeraceae bacterium]
LGEALRHQIAEFGATVGPIDTARIFLIDTDADTADVSRAATGLLVDPVVEKADMVPPGHGDDDGHSRIEVHLKPGVMDPVAASTEMALRDMGIPVREVRTGRAYRIRGKVAAEQLKHIADRVLANGVIESVHFSAYVPDRFPRGHEYQFKIRHVPIRELTDSQLTKLSREGHLFLSLAEMKAVQTYYREQGREPTDAELETIAQTWSEHCVHKTLKSAVDVEVRDASGKVVGTRHYDNLIKETIFASTQQLIAKNKRDFCLSVFKDNAGVIAFDDTDAVCFKVETHNHPSAIEPYGGSATGVGGVIRDILGTGLAARPIANTDVFCVAYPDYGRGTKARRHEGTEGGSTTTLRAPVPDASVPSLPRGVIHPKRILQQVVAGVRDYGNRMGIPTVNGAVYFDDRYVGNPLVFCGCVGVIPRNKIEKAARPGDAVVVMGGRTGRDGIHGATFSSAELTDTHADEFSHAVQIGNAVTEKKVADVILRARDRGLFTAVTDCGAGGLSSAVGEMGENVGAAVELDKVPLKYAGLRYDEIWISEAQERMVLSVPPDKLPALLELSAEEDVESSVIGTFGTPDRQLVLRYRGQEVGRLSMHFLHHGIPMPRRKAIVAQRETPFRGTGFQPVRATSGGDGPRTSAGPDRQHGLQTRVTDEVKRQLLALLAHPNIASKHWIIRQYDHEVQGGSVIKPLVGPRQVGPSDAAVVRPKLGSYRGVAIANGLAPHVPDPYRMAIASIDEAVRNAVAVGADPDRLAILDNFCWPSVDDEHTMGALVAACEACRDAALAYGVPFISGKDSLHNQFTNSETGEVIRIPNTLLISAIGVIDDVRKCVTSELKRPTNVLYRLEPVGQTLEALAAAHRQVAGAIRTGRIVACHDISEGGWLVAAAEMCIGSGLGLLLEPDDRSFFDEPVGQYLVEFEGDDAQFEAMVTSSPALKFHRLGAVQHSPEIVLHLDEEGVHATVDELTKAWRGTLDW